MRRLLVICLFLLGMMSSVAAKVVSVVDSPAGYSSYAKGTGFAQSREQKTDNYKAPDSRCEKYVGFVSTPPANQDCEAGSPQPQMNCYKNCHCAYGLGADCTCNASRFFALESLPGGTEPSGETCTTNSHRQTYYAVRCKAGFVPDAGKTSCSCPYGEDASCWCNSKEYPIGLNANFDYQAHDYAKCPQGDYYKISKCKKEGYQLENGRCVPQCQKGYTDTIAFCGEDHTLVEQEGLPACRKCEKNTCPTDYSFSNDCPNGTTVAEHPTQKGCYQCNGIACRGEYKTYNICQNGQTKIVQQDNPLCVSCQGTACLPDYAPDAKCGAGQTVLRQDSNPVCLKCLGSSCEEGYALGLSCQDGQTKTTQSNNPNCVRCSGTACNSGYTAKINSCLVGEILSVQPDNFSCKKCN